jgi:hypothetical protein
MTAKFQLVIGCADPGPLARFRAPRPVETRDQLVDAEA